MALFNDSRRLDRHARWASLLICAITWIFFANPIDIPLQLAGVIFLGAVLLQTWKEPRIPVFAYHSVSEDGSWLGKPGLIVPLSSFRKQICWLARHHYITLSLDEVQEHRAQCKVGKKYIALTFDDGYLDNWVGVEPVLREYKMRGSVFVSTAWIEQGQQCRPQIVNQNAKNITWTGYLNASEIRALSAGGVLDIQSHAVSHDTIFCGDQIADFATPGRQPQWLTVLLNPESKPIWYKLDNPVPAGYPLFPTGEALAVPAFRPDPAFIDEITTIATDTTFFTQRNWRQILYKATKRFRSDHGKLGQMETVDETRQRWRQELEESKHILSKITGREIKHLCWPRDASCLETEQLAFSIGYKSVTGGSGTNGYSNPHVVSRLYVEACGVEWLDLSVFVMQIWLFKGHIWVWPLQALGSRLIQLIRHVKR